MGRNSNSKDSEYSSDLENYIEGEDKYQSEDIDFDESSFNNSTRGVSKLDEYLDINDDGYNEEEKINYCSICGNELKKFNYGDKCDDCIKKIGLVDDINLLLDYMSPSEELKKENLLFAGFDELKLNIIISNLLNENLILFGSNGIYLADVKTLNDFFRIYGSANDLLDESLYKHVMFSDGFVDISKYSDLVQIMFNSKNSRWEVNLFRNRSPILKKFFTNIFDANDYARHYLKEIGELDNLKDKTPVKLEEINHIKSNHKFILFSTKRNQWFVKVKGPAGSKIVGFYDTEDEAVEARDAYLESRKKIREIVKPTYQRDERDSKIKFHERSNQWVVIVKSESGRFKKLGFFDTEEEAIVAKNKYYGIVTEKSITTEEEEYGIVSEEPLSIKDEQVSDVKLKFGFKSTFGEGDEVLVISGQFKNCFGVILGFDEERDSLIVKLENSNVPYPIFIKSDYLELV